ncbi:MAG: glycosyltransferase [Magnetospirillum sp.]|nr:glycosyltransferase [Magnetospirillum sp.]
MIVVGHLITGLGSGGAERMLTRVAGMSDRNRFRHVVVSLTDEGFFGPVLRTAGIAVHSLGLRRGLPNPATLFRLVALLRREKPDVLMTWLYHADFLGTLAAPLAGVPSLVWNLRCSDMDLRRYSRQSALVVKALARLSRVPDVVLANSRAGIAAHRALGYTPRRWEMIPNGLDLAEFTPDPDARSGFRQQLGLAPDDVVVGMVGRFDPMKDHATFLGALAAASRCRPRVRGLLVGRGTEPGEAALDALVGESGLGDRLMRLGERRDIPKILPAFDVLVSASAFGEGFPNVVAEAMACGVPAVVTDVGDSREVVGDAGFVVPPRSPERLAGALDRVLALPRDSLRALGETARNRAVERFSLAQVVDRYEALFAALSPCRPH